MVRLSLNLPGRYQFRLFLKKRPGPSIRLSLIKRLTRFVGKRGGTKVSRLLRFLFDHYSIKNILGTNLVILSIASSFIDIPHPTPYENETFEVASPVVLTTKQGVRVPLEAKNVTQGFWSFHQGVDLNGKTGDSVYSISVGVIEMAEFSNSGYGKMVVVDHGNDFKTLYAHLSRIDVAVGQKVDNETKIGEVGATGRAFGDHLHFEVYENGRTINPLTILPK